jgi:hypothetical protein
MKYANIAEYLATLGVSVAILICIAYKTRERPRWNWGAISC